MRVSNAFVGLNLDELFPDSQVLAKNLGIQIAAFHAQRDDERAARRKAAPTDTHYAKLLTKFDEILHELGSLREQEKVANDPLSNQVRRAKKLTNRLHKCINELDRVEREIPFGEKCHSLIFAISRIVIRDLEAMAAAQPMNAYDYLTGKYRHYWLTTTTQSLCTGLNRNTLTFEEIAANSADKRQNNRFQAKAASFRGVTGFYAALEKSGFILDKVVDGTKVRLKINLDWVFGWSLNVLQDPNVIAEMAICENTVISTPNVGSFFGEFTGENSSHFSQNNKFKETEYNVSGVASLLESSPTASEREKKESEEKETAPVEKSSTGPKIFVKNEENVALEVATDSAVRIMKLIFNMENVRNGIIRHNSTNPVKEISQRDALGMKYFMLNTMQAVKREGETWADVATLVNEAIENTAKYVQKHKFNPEFYIYEPKRYLDPLTRKGSLKNYIETHLHSRPAQEQPNQSNPLNSYLPNIQWYIEQGGNETVIKRQIKKYGGNEAGQKTVSDAITVARGRMLVYDLKPTNGIVSYVLGILNKFKTADELAVDAEKLRVKYAEKQRENNPKVWWTLERVVDVWNTIAKQNPTLFLTMADVEYFAKAYKNRQPNAEAQLKEQLERRAKNNRDQQSAKA